MEKIDDTRREPQIIWMAELVSKVNEMVAWINEREKRERELLEEINKGLHARR